MPITTDTLTDDMIREEWRRWPVMTGEFYYALKRNARLRDGLQSDDEFSQFCERCAKAVVDIINERWDRAA